MVAFAGYAMPVQYQGVLAEHLHCRAQAALFDVSHMGQATLSGATAAAALERLVPGDMLGLKPGRQRYTLLTNEAGGILDDLMVANLGDERLFLVVNASRKEIDFTHIAANLPSGVQLHAHEDRALLALQGPAAAAVIGRIGAGGRAAAVHGRGRGDARRRALPGLALRLHRRGRVRDLGARRQRRGGGAAHSGRSPRSSPPASARAIRCGWRPGSASTATTSTN